MPSAIRHWKLNQTGSGPALKAVRVGESRLGFRVHLTSAINRYMTKRGPKSAEPILTTELCKFGCGLTAQFISANGRYMCCSSANKCIINKQKNSKALEAGYEKGRKCSLTDDQRIKGGITRGEMLSSKREWHIFDAPWSEVPKRTYRPRILHEQNHMCLECKMEPSWNGKSLVFQLDHIDGNNQNNERSNLRMICPNCHSQTETFTSKNASAEGKLRMGWRKAS